MNAENDDFKIHKILNYVKLIESKGMKDFIKTTHINLNKIKKSEYEDFLE
jgi:hypothetical protein